MELPIRQAREWSPPNNRYSISLGYNHIFSPTFALKREPRCEPPRGAVGYAKLRV